MIALRIVSVKLLEDKKRLTNTNTKRWLFYDYIVVVTSVLNHLRNLLNVVAYLSPRTRTKTNEGATISTSVISIKLER